MGTPWELGELLCNAARRKSTVDGLVSGLVKQACCRRKVLFARVFCASSMTLASIWISSSKDFGFIDPLSFRRADCPESALARPADLAPYS